jgi:dihydroneopterin aldolase
MTRMLASVQDANEAQLALDGGADIIDFKDPSHGALGALDPELIAQGLRRVNNGTFTSATTGDWPLDPVVLTQAVRRIGETGVDYVKLGLIPGPSLQQCVEALAATTSEYRLVAVLFADRGVPIEILPILRAAGFKGAMIDTFDKQAGGLRRHMTEGQLRAFVGAARGAGLMSGLAGSLRIDDVPALLSIEPDLLGFRGALCEGADRRTALSMERIRAVRKTVNRLSTTIS